MTSGSSSSGDKRKQRVEYWWPGEKAMNTRDCLLTASHRRLHGQKVPLNEVMTTLKTTFREDKVPREQYPSKEQVNNWFQRHRYKARSVSDQLSILFLISNSGSIVVSH